MGTVKFRIGGHFKCYPCLPIRNLKPIPKLDKKLEFKFALKEKLFSFPLVKTGGAPRNTQAVVECMYEAATIFGISNSIVIL